MGDNSRDLLVGLCADPIPESVIMHECGTIASYVALLYGYFMFGFAGPEALSGPGGQLPLTHLDTMIHTEK